MKRLIPLLLLIAAAGPATKPAATAPTTQPDPATAELKDAQHALGVETVKAINAFNNSPAGRPLVADVEIRLRLLEQARATGTAQDKLDASSAFNSARAELDKARAAAVLADPGVKAAQAKVDSAKDAIDRAVKDAAAKAEDKKNEEQSAVKAAEAAKMRDPMNKAAVEGRILVGMTQQQVRAAMKINSVTLRDVESAEDAYGQTVVWSLNGSYPDTVIFHNGVVVRTHSGG